MDFWIGNSSREVESSLIIQIHSLRLFRKNDFKLNSLAVQTLVCKYYSGFIQTVCRGQQVIKILSFFMYNT